MVFWLRLRIGDSDNHGFVVRFPINNNSWIEMMDRSLFVLHQTCLAETSSRFRAGHALRIELHDSFDPTNPSILMASLLR